MKLLPDENRSIYVRWFLIGFLIRLTFMPFTLHGDMGDFNQLAAHLTYRGFLPPNQMAYPPLAYYTMAFFQWLFKPIMPQYGGPRLAVSWIYSSHVFRYCFLLKSYYLIFDFGIAFLLLRLLGDNMKKLLIFKFWMLNPVVIFICYVQGQFDVIPAFFVILSLYYVLISKLARSLFWLGIGVAFKNFPVFLVIPALILLGKTKLEKCKFLLLAIVPYIILIYPYLRVSENAGVTSKISMRIFKFYFNLGGFDKLYVFVVGYVVILMFAYLYIGWQNSKSAFGALWRTDLVIFLWFFLTTQFHPQWFIWIMPLLILFVVKNEKLRAIYWIQILCLFIYTFHFGSQVILRPFLNVTVSPSFYSHVKTPSQIIAQFFPSDVFINIFRSIFSAALIWMIYEVYKGFLKVNKKQMV